MAIKKRKVQTCIVISPQNPSRDSGYGIALESSLIKYTTCYKNVYYIAVDDKLPNKINTHIKNYIALKPNNKSIQYRFLLSLMLGIPAVCVKYVSDEIKKGIIKNVKLIYSEHKTDDVDIILEDIPLGYYINILRKITNRKAKIILRSHNILGEIFQGIGENKNLLTKTIFNFENARMAKFEKTVLNDVDFVFAITGRDKKEYFRRYGIICDGVLGVCLPEISLDTKHKNINFSNVLYVGSADMRKEVGLRRFIAEEWPKIIRVKKEAKLILAGKGTEVFDNQKLGVYGLGFVTNLGDVLNEGQFFINPQIVGSGIKIKSLLALKCEKTLISTKKGCEGICVEDGSECIITDSISGMGDAIVKLFNCHEVAIQIAKNGKNHVEYKFSMNHLLE